MFRTSQQGDVALRIVGDQARYNRNCGVALVVNSEKNFVFWIILGAETGVVLVGGEVNAMHRLQDTYRRLKCLRWGWRRRRVRFARKSQRGKNCQQVIDERKSGDYQDRNDPSVVEMNHCGGLILELSRRDDSDAYANEKHAGPAEAVHVFLQSIFCAQRTHHITQR